MSSETKNVGAALCRDRALNRKSRHKAAPTLLSSICLSQLLILVVLYVGCSQEQEIQPASLPDLYDYRANSISELREHFQSPPRQAAPWVYWFWFENVVNRENITRELEEIAAAGIAGVELRCVTMHGFPGTPGPKYDPEGWAEINHQKYEFLSEEFIDILDHTLAEAERLGLRFAMNLGMGWPPGGPWITDEHRSKHLISESRLLSGPLHLSGSSAITVEPDTRIHAWKVKGSDEVDPDSFIDLTEQVDASGNLNWQVPQGEWLLGLFRTVSGGLVDKGNGPELDPASAEAVDFHLHYMFDRLDGRLSKYYGSTFESMATDSWEYARSRQGGRYWSPALLKESQRVLGYSFDKHMYSLLGYGPDKAERLKDLAHLEEQLIHESYFGRVGRFLNERGLRHRPQIYGRGLERNLMDVYALVDIPELEEGVYVPEAVWVSRLLGKPIVSEEAFTHLSIRDSNLAINGLRGGFTAVTNPEDMWKATPERIRRFANAHYARGINRVQYHSFSYSPPELPEPGWRMYAEVFLNRNVSWWNEWPQLNQWMARNQYAMQSGKPVTEFMVYPQKPNPIDGPFNVPDDQPWTAMNAVDAVNHAVLETMIEQQTDQIDCIQNVILREEPKTVDEAQLLLQLAEQGIPFWSLVGLPDSWDVLSTSNRADLRQRFSDSKVQMRDAKGQSWLDVAEANRSVSWLPADGKLSYQRRQFDDGELFLVSSWEEAFDGEVLFSAIEGAVEIMDAKSGEIRSLEVKQSYDGKVVIPIELERNNSALILFRR